MSVVRNLVVGLGLVGGLAGGFHAVAPVAAQNCDTAYVNYCIPSPSVVGDLDCPDMYAQGVAGIQLAQIGYDPHGFDGDSDGIGCEG